MTRKRLDLAVELDFRARAGGHVDIDIYETTHPGQYVGTITLAGTLRDALLAVLTAATKPQEVPHVVPQGASDAR